MTGPVTSALGLGTRQMFGCSTGRELWNGRMCSESKKVMPRRFSLPVADCKENVFHSSLTHQRCCYATSNSFLG